MFSRFLIRRSARATLLVAITFCALFLTSSMVFGLPPGITSISPTPNSATAPLSTSIVLTYSGRVVEEDSRATYEVYGSMTGRHNGTILNIGSTQIFNPSRDFLPGERVTVVLTDLDWSWAFWVASQDGTGEFDQSQLIAWSGTVDAIGLADVDNDGLADLVTGVGGQLLVRKNLGARNFASPVTLSLPSYAVGLCVTDVNADGNVDLVAACCGPDLISMFAGNGTGGFAAGVTHGVGNCPNSVLTGDWDLDRDLDLITGNGTGDDLTGVYNDGAGNYYPGVTHYASCDGPWDIVDGDFNGDGIQDIAVSSLNKDSLYLHLGLGDGNFGFPFRFPGVSSPNRLDVLDTENDGDLDVVLASRNSGLIRILVNQGGGTFTPSGLYNAPGDIGDVCTGDFNADGLLDIATITSYNDSSLSILVAQGAGVYSPADDYQLFGGGNRLNAADLDGDGALDLYVRSGAYATTIVFWNSVSCCVNTRGNVDGSPDDAVSLGDLTVVIDHLFISLAPLVCWEEGNLDGSLPEGPGSVTLGDLTVMIDHLFITLDPLSACP